MHKQVLVAERLHTPSFFKGGGILLLSKRDTDRASFLLL
jgi:hypothetical protein